jgi:fido (protein-threonine AMPylation protein)
VNEPIRRHSVAEEPLIVTDDLLRAQIEARNGLRQFDLGMRAVEDALAKGVAFKYRPSLVQALHRAALAGLSANAGLWRPASVSIEGSAHQPVAAHLVAEKIEDLCDYLNENRGAKSPIHLSAYVMWNLNWIHPFTDGNGRTSRILSYVVLCIEMRNIILGESTIPDQIVKNRVPYFDALEDADRRFKEGAIDVSAMERLLSGMFAKQLTDLYEKAAGKLSGE